MRNRRERQWADRIDARSRERGVSLPRHVLDELVEHLHDLYAAEVDAGHSEQAAASTVEQVIDDGRYHDVSRAPRARRRDSRLFTRVSVSGLFSGTVFDVRYAFRAMLRQLPLTGTVIAILAVCVGATTAAYGVINTTLLRPLPYPSSDRLVVVKHGSAPSESRAFAAGDWLDYTSRRSLAELAAYSSWPMNLTGSGEPERLRSVIVSGRFFEVIGVAAAKGRTTSELDDSPAASPVVVLSDAFWRRRYGADPSIVGQTLTINNQRATVVGVMPATFALPDATVDLWMPMGLSPAVRADHNGEWLSLIGRLPPLGSTELAEADLSTEAAQLAKAYPRPSRDTRIVVRRLSDDLLAQARRPLLLGGLAAVFVLIAGLANAANLLLARATTRRDEIAVRAALGADRLRIARQLLIESSLFTAVAGALGSALAWALLRLFSVMPIERLPRADQVHLDTPVVIAALAVSALAALFIGGCTVWLTARLTPDSLETASSQRVVRSAPLQRVMLAMQVAFAIVLVTGAVLIARAYITTVQTDAGFDTSHTQTMQVTLPRSQYPDNASQIRFGESALQALRALPGVVDTGIVSDLPFEANATHFAVIKRGETDASARMMTVRLADPGFFTTLRIPVIAGRAFDEHDRAGGVAVAVVNRSGANRLAGGRRAIGERVRVTGDVERVVVGMVGDIKHAGLHEDEGPVVYVPYAQKTFEFLNWMGLVARTAGTPLPATAIRQAVAGVDPKQPVESVRTMADYLDREAAPYRFTAVIVGSLAGMALLLALTGIYGLTTFIVERRRRELALRLALGASEASIVFAVGRPIVVALTIGALAGILASFLLIGVLAPVREVALSGANLPIAVAAWLILAAIAAAATLRPALRGARLDPISNLHCE